MARTPKQPDPKTLQQRFGFMDEDMKTDKHDEIMLWLDQHIEDVIALLFPGDWTERQLAFVKEQTDYHHQHMLESHRVEYDELVAAGPPPRPPVRVLEKTWEYSILNKAKDPIGFVDMRVVVEIARLTGDWQHPYFVYQDKIPVYFEVKSYIKSLGELLRQIRMYQAHLPEAPFVVVSPDNRFVETLREQGIHFVPYPL